VNSSSAEAGISIDGQPTAEAAASVVRWLEQQGRGSAQVNFKLRDWLFARQRYWGEPFPIVYPEGSSVSFLMPARLLACQAGQTPHNLLTFTNWVLT
jgi:leucyl-tRNA synthetase